MIAACAKTSTLSLMRDKTKLLVTLNRTEPTLAPTSKPATGKISS